MDNRVYNFNAGPSTLPIDVLKTVQEELLDYHGTGISILESSHRSPEYQEINEQAIALTREILGLDDSFHVLFLTGGASQQFFQIPMNFLSGDKVGAYADTGVWSTKAIEEARIIGKTHVSFEGNKTDFAHIPTKDELDIPTNAAYLHITTNNTVKGTQYHYIPETSGIPMIADMSSDIASRQLDYTMFDMFYAGAQKNLGPAGTTLVVIKDTYLQQTNDSLPTLLNYKTQANKKSLYNTPPCFAIYIIKLVFEWIKEQGGLAAVEKTNIAKKERIYQLMDLYPDYYRSTAEPDSRSWMNITMRLPSEELEKKFIAEGKASGLVGLKGHRSVGGVRVSLYNAMPIEGADKVAEFMYTFMKKN